MKLDKIKFAELIAFISPRMKRTMDNIDLQEIDNIIDVELPQPDMAYPNTSDINYLMELMAGGQKKIEAIKMHRKLTGWGLKESKDQVEKYWVSKPAVELHDPSKPYDPNLNPN